MFTATAETQGATRTGEPFAGSTTADSAGGLRLITPRTREMLIALNNVFDAPLFANDSP